MGVAEERRQMFDDMYKEVIEVLKEMCEGNDKYFTTQQMAQAVRERLDKAPNDRYDNIRLSNSEVSMRLGILLSARYVLKGEGLKRTRNTVKSEGGTHRYRYEFN